MITVNGTAISEADLGAEAARHQGAEDPMMSAAHELVLRELLRQRAAELGIAEPDAEAAVRAVLAAEVKTPAADEDTCRRYFEQHLERFMTGESVEVSHILFQLTPRIDPQRLRAHATGILNGLLAGREDFAECARRYSNCPSGAGGGQLGELRRGDAVEEFERAVFSLPGDTLAPRLIDTRYGFHIVRTGRKQAGEPGEYEAVKPMIASWLEAASRRRAESQYLQWLVGQARIRGVAMQGADTPLVQ
ncbi:peptidylprolyl isomerase [Bordetella genomosp. 10]|uniref:peptidylprolyl isomerase n=1 Tax=Bordetella genomosp. 10 TaxID=1416804 RepID=A0A261SJB7_9BORD|nr:peptidylprolyl isomerase [Bordetella genomosp. 10]OZI37529.1 peptidylprolyl isomerase [Bordetella genomosp. 10]